jgi:hypothetical protein
MSDLCFECEEGPGGFRCNRCREDVCTACVEAHVCADLLPAEPEEPAE